MICLSPKTMLEEVTYVCRRLTPTARQADCLTQIPLIRLSTREVEDFFLARNQLLHRRPSAMTLLLPLASAAVSVLLLPMVAKSAAFYHTL